jgi:hypothetical protein
MSLAWETNRGRTLPRLNPFSSAAFAIPACIPELDSTTTVIRLHVLSDGVAAPLSCWILRQEDVQAKLNLGPLAGVRRNWQHEAECGVRPARASSECDQLRTVMQNRMASP